MIQEMIDKRKALRTLSNAAIQAAEDIGINPDKYKVNDLLMLLIYNPQQTHTYSTFIGWKLQGHTIIKGSKAYMLWGQPINRTRTDKATGKTIQGNDDNTEAPFFPLAYLFRDDQTIKIETREPRPETTKEPSKQQAPINIDI